MSYASQTAALAKERLTSLDALRGFYMFFIVGGSALITKAIQGLHLGFLEWMVHQLHHPAWGEPITFNDFIFSLFLFMAGVSLVFSVTSARKKGKSDKEIYGHAFQRMLILTFLGIIYKNQPLHFDWENIRYVSVLGRIGITGFFATLIVCSFNLRAQVYWIFSLLIFYWILVMFVPVPGVGAGVMTLEGNMIGYIDRAIVPGRLLNEIYDELGFTGHISATALVLIGAWCGQILKREDLLPVKRVRLMASAGALLVILGLLWGLHFPIMKYLWSSSFVLVTGGAAVLLLTAFHWVIDILGFKKWTFVFVVFGMNSLTIYLFAHLVDLRFTVDYLLNGLYELTQDDGVNVFLQMLGVFVIQWLLMYFLYRKRIFIKV